MSEGLFFVSETRLCLASKVKVVFFKTYIKYQAVKKFTLVACWNLCTSYKPRTTYLSTKNLNECPQKLAELNLFCLTYSSIGKVLNFIVCGRSSVLYPWNFNNFDNLFRKITITSEIIKLENLLQNNRILCLSALSCS